MESYFKTMHRISQIQSSMHRLNYNGFNQKQSGWSSIQKNDSKQMVSSKSNLLGQKNYESLKNLVGVLKSSSPNGSETVGSGFLDQHQGKEVNLLEKIKKIQAGQLESKIDDQKKNPKNSKAEIESFIRVASKKYDIPYSLIHSIIKVESNFDHRAVSHKNAMGLMQLIPETAKQLKVDDPFDPQENIDGGTRYFKELLESYDGNIVKTLAAYNAGKEALKNAGDKVPNYLETQNYVQKVIKNYLKMNGIKYQ